MMKYANALGLTLMLAVLAGCGEQGKAPPKKDNKAVAHDDHDHGKGPNGGVVFDFGKYHAEFTVDHDKKECTVVVLGADEKTVTAVAAKDMTVTTKEAKAKDGKAVPAMTIKLQAKDEKDGKASKYVGTDPGLGNVADFEGTVTGEVGGKPSQGTFKE